ncbi:MAG: IS66 family transposase [Succinivibrio sp.]|nr:IS66 family transposase [Succinivibrio sp.]
MDFNELKQDAEKICQELKDKAPADLSVLVLSLSTIIKMMINMFSGVMEQNETSLEQNKKLSLTIESLQDEIKELKRQLGQNSNNSSKPPSSDGYAKSPKKRSLRKTSGLKAGGQKGHKGANLSVPHDPDEVKTHIPDKCKCCSNLTSCLASDNVFACDSSRYVIEAKITTHVVEHQLITAKNCPCGEKSLTGEFPKDVKAYVQYGDSLTVLSGLLSTYGAVSLNRIHVLLSSLLNISITPGTICSMVKRCAQKVGPVMEKVKELLIKADVGHFDETGLRALGKLFWGHNSSNSKLTYQTVNCKRGSDGMDDNGVLPDFTGVACHDGWTSYQNYEDIEHALCCAHLLRELNAVKENEENHKWADKFSELLLGMKSAKEIAISKGISEFSKERLEAFSKEYDDIMKLADKESPPPNSDKKTRGRRKLGKTRALIERLKKFKEDVCRFVHNFAVPFDNNQAERDVRNVKTKVKVSGCFRSLEGAQNYVKLMSFISTGNKHGISAFDALTAAFSGNADIILGDGSE